jgi:hypothetical protein
MSDDLAQLIADWNYAAGPGATALADTLTAQTNSDPAPPTQPDQVLGLRVNGRRLLIRAPRRSLTAVARAALGQDPVAAAADQAQRLLGKPGQR